MQATKTPDPQGRYQDAVGNRFTVRCCGRILLPTDSLLVVTETESLAAFLNAQGLTPMAPTRQQAFEVAIAAGYTVPGVTPPLVLDMGDSARVLFHQLSYQLFTMLTAERIAPTDPVTIRDIEGDPRSFSVANVQTMIMGLGEAYLALFTALHTPTSSNL